MAKGLLQYGRQFLCQLMIQYPLINYGKLALCLCILKVKLIHSEAKLSRSPKVGRSTCCRGNIHQKWQVVATPHVFCSFPRLKHFTDYLSLQIGIGWWHLCIVNHMSNLLCIFWKLTSLEVGNTIKCTNYVQMGCSQALAILSFPVRCSSAGGWELPVPHIYTPSPLADWLRDDM